ncbi:hypothetical protein C7A07_18995 [Pseudomonas fragi]|nr:hypothetical protein C7A07_18995 [Pseudomonas fragi]
MPGHHGCGAAAGDVPGVQYAVTPPCGSGLARDASDAVFELNRVEAIAGKPAPTGSALFRRVSTLPQLCDAGALLICRLHLKKHL